MRLYAVACDVVARPIYLCAARSPHVVDVRLFERGLHNEPANLRDRLQEAIDDAPASAEAVVLGYGLCGGATAGIEARRIPVVLPRAHDCITLFLGSRERYGEEHGKVATYWYVADQLERNDGYRAGVGGLAIGSDTDAQVEAIRAEYVAKYGEDNADYLMEVMGGWRLELRAGGVRVDGRCRRGRIRGRGPGRGRAPGLGVRAHGGQPGAPPPPASTATGTRTCWSCSPASDWR